jgi:hypothetical protein
MNDNEPLVGWRLWRLYGDRLYSWVADHVWQPGDNLARCLVTGADPCDHVPGAGCHCGFWALNSPVRCMRSQRVRVDRHGPFLTGHAVLGLMAGWGEVARHGDEGFRSRMARPLLLVSDRIGPSWLALLGWGRRGWPEALRRTAGAYGVPLVSMEAAARGGVLRELGVPGAMVREAAQLVRPGAGREYPAGLHGGER